MYHRRSRSSIVIGSRMVPGADAFAVMRLDLAAMGVFDARMKFHK
jgi:hypothetical protein